MATTTTIDLTHPTQIVTDDRPYGLGHRAECACGWASAWTDDLQAAEAAEADHREVAVGPGDGLDRVMSELLDLQDDLAAVVVWLAENWSADLPVPIVYACDVGIGFDPARVKVSACCLNPAELTRIAHLLGVPPVDDEQPNSRGVRYRNVRRDFGRVTLDAFHRLPETTGRAS
jgi:hypothetical protein